MCNNSKEVDIQEALDLLNKNEEPLCELYSIFNSVKTSLPILALKIPQNRNIIRVRINLPYDRKFSNIAQLKEPPSENTGYQRANVPGIPMFYASVLSHTDSIEGKNLTPRIVTIYETSTFAKNTDSLGIERVTFSSWSTVDELKLFALPSMNYVKPCEEVKCFVQQSDLLLQKYTFTEDAIALAKAMSLELSKEFPNGGTQYFIIANFVQWFLSKNNEFDGIIYPSVQLKGEGLNIAIKPNVAEQKLRFMAAAEYDLYKRGAESKLVKVSTATFDVYGDLFYMEDCDIEEWKRNEPHWDFDALQFVHNESK